MIKKFKDLGDGVHQNIETGRIVVEKGEEDKKDDELKARVIGTYYPNLRR